MCRPRKRYFDAIVVVPARTVTRQARNRNDGELESLNWESGREPNQESVRNQARRGFHIQGGFRFPVEEWEPVEGRQGLPLLHPGGNTGAKVCLRERLTKCLPHSYDATSW